jgi:transcriptional regulator with XRE-family HTH domain
MNVAKNIKKIREEKSINQQVIADALDVDVSVVSNIEKGKREVKVNELEIIAKALNVDAIYLLTYPHEYVKKNQVDEPIEAILQIKLRSDKKEQVLKLVFGENNLEILNK